MEQQNVWGSRKTFIMVYICQVLGISNINTIPNNALAQGALGSTIFLVIFYIVMGIPLLYMECVVGQFTARDCIDAWKIRPCLSYVGYMLITWQVFILIYNHTVTAFLLHYLLISFENPIPFYTCGSWSSKYCNCLSTNYTVNLDCVKNQNLYSYCDKLHQTFPEYQYWRQNLVYADDTGNFYIAWRVCLASGVICLCMFLCCFKRSQSFKWIVSVLVGYPMLALAILMMGSMRQKGMVLKYEEAIDIDFSVFGKKFRLSNVIQQVVFNLSIGSGITFNLSAKSPFRSPCFSDTIITVAICTIFTIVSVFTTAMMTCPYALKYGTMAASLMRLPISLTFEKIPTLIYEYDSKLFYLILIFSCNFVLGFGSGVLIFYNLLEIVFMRYSKIAKYPGLSVFCCVIFIFVFTIPFLSNQGVNIMAHTFRRYITLIASFIAMLECFVFIYWYGMHRFSEDIHFMLGFQPNNFIRMAWFSCLFFLVYAFYSEAYNHLTNPNNFIYATYALLSFVAFICIVIIVKLIIAVIRNKLRMFISLDPTWGPKSDLLQRSRAMFSAHAMTKEYIYRQYHLQAGIIARQNKSNQIFCTR